MNKVLYYFEQISRIPRGSGNEKAVSDYIVGFAKSLGFEVMQDSNNNVIVRKLASKGYEKSEPVIIQGHMDMVCEKNEDVVHNFEKDPIKVIYDGDIIHAEGTTLGADDGIAVAMAMAALSDNTLEHPLLEAVFTTEEETTMAGASALDISLIKGKRLINIDSEIEGIFTVGCAGGRKPAVHLPVEYIKAPFDSFLKIKVTGLTGGHSGLDIHKGRANANRVIAEILDNITDDSCYLCYVAGGAKENAIPRESEAVVCCNDIETVRSRLSAITADIKKRYADTDSDMEILTESVPKYDKAMSVETADGFINAVKEIPNGVIAMDTELNMVKTSNNIGVIKTSENEIGIFCAVRSAVTAEKLAVYDEIVSIGNKYKGKTNYRGDYPAWEYRSESPLRDMMVRIYSEMFGKPPVIETVHAGLECGIISQKLPEMDMVSIGPNLYDIHSPAERASISSIDRMWNFITEVLRQMK